MCIEGTDTETLRKLIINVQIFDLWVSTDKQLDKQFSHTNTDDRCGNRQADTFKCRPGGGWPHNKWFAHGELVINHRSVTSYYLLYNIDCKISIKSPLTQKANGV